MLIENDDIKDLKKLSDILYIQTQEGDVNAKHLRGKLQKIGPYVSNLV